jgi:hypothetical protein
MKKKELRVFGDKPLRCNIILPFNIRRKERQVAGSSRKLQTLEENTIKLQILEESSSN